MGFRFQRRIKILPGVTLNVSKSGVSTSIGTRGAHVTLGKNGVRTTVGIPGTGISYTTVSKGASSKKSAASAGLPYLKRCPYCGHGMRKRWEACPECGHTLEQPLPVGWTKCACGRVYPSGTPRCCFACGRQLVNEPLKEWPPLTEEMEKAYEAEDCSVCPHCNGPVPNREGTRYCNNCGGMVTTKRDVETIWYAIGLLVVIGVIVWWIGS